jgi:hypothetical protein
MEILFALVAATLWIISGVLSLAHVKAKPLRSDLLNKSTI